MNNGYKECAAEHACSTSDAKAIACSGAVKEMASLKKPVSFHFKQLVKSNFGESVYLELIDTANVLADKRLSEIQDGEGCNV